METNKFYPVGKIINQMYIVLLYHLRYQMVSLFRNQTFVQVVFDYGHKQIKFTQPYFPGENREEDFKNYKNFFKGTIGKIPEFT